MATTQLISLWVECGLDNAINHPPNHHKQVVSLPLPVMCGLWALFYPHCNECVCIYAGFHKWGYPKTEGLQGNILINMDDLGHTPIYMETSICT